MRNWTIQLSDLPIAQLNYSITRLLDYQIVYANSPGNRAALTNDHAALTNDRAQLSCQPLPGSAVASAPRDSSASLAQPVACQAVFDGADDRDSARDSRLEPDMTAGARRLRQQLGSGVRDHLLVRCHH